MTHFSFLEYNQAFRSAVISAYRGVVLYWKRQGWGDLYDERWLHVKYHIIAMTAVAFAHASITSPASDGEVCMCAGLDCCETAQRVFFLRVCVSNVKSVKCVCLCVCVRAAGLSVFHFVCWGSNWPVSHSIVGRSGRRQVSGSGGEEGEERA